MELMNALPDPKTHAKESRTLPGFEETTEKEDAKGSSSQGHFSGQQDEVAVRW